MAIKENSSLLDELQKAYGIVESLLSELDKTVSTHLPMPPPSPPPKRRRGLLPSPPPHLRLPHGHGRLRSQQGSTLLSQHGLAPPVLPQSSPPPAHNSDEEAFAAVLVTGVTPYPTRIGPTSVLRFAGSSRSVPLASQPLGACAPIPLPMIGTTTHSPAP